MGTDWENRWNDGDTPWDKGEPSPPLVNYVQSHSLSGKVLVPGCGAGHDAAFLSQQGFEVTGVDFAPTALKQARNRYSELGIRWICDDLLDPQKEWGGPFDTWVEHTCLCALEPKHWEAYINTLSAQLKKGGIFMGVLFKNPDVEEGPPFRITDQQISQLFSSFEFVEKFEPDSAYPGREGREEVWIYRR